MKIPIILLLFSSFFFLSCNRQEEKKEDSKSKFAIITLNLDYADPSIVETKAPSDCNIYYYCDALKFSHHAYGTYGSAVVESLPQGNYDIYTIVGFGSDLGPKTKAELEGLSINSTDRTSVESNNTFTNKSSHTITRDATINIAVTRLLAKVDFNITVDPAFAPNFTLEYMELLNINNKISLYADSKLTNGAINYPKEVVTGTAVSKSYLLHENLQGVNSSITDQRHKTSGNAPSDKCTHLHIRGYSNGAKVDYYIYLGANNTNDFNLKRNHHYIVNTTILGVDDIDNRVSVIDATITEFEKAIYELPEQAKSTLSLKSIRQGNPIYLSYQILEGNGLLSVDGTQVQPNTQHLITNGDIDANIPLLFGQLQDGNVKLAITVTDNNGFTLYKEISTKYESVKSLEVVASGELEDRLNYSKTISLDISEENYTGDITIKYELVTGAIETSYNSMIIPSGQIITGKVGKYDFACKSIILGAVKIKFTITDSHGQSKEVIKEVTVASAFNIQFNVKVYNKTVRSSSSRLVLDVIPCLKLTMVTPSPLPFSFEYIHLEINVNGKQFYSPYDFAVNAGNEIQGIDQFWVIMNELKTKSFVAGTSATKITEYFETIATDWGVGSGGGDNRIGIGEFELIDPDNDYSQDYEQKYKNIITPAWLWCTETRYSENTDIDVISAAIMGYKIDTDLYKVNFKHDKSI